MSNFTKSILYSTTVMVAGLAAIFAIYSNVSNISPAISVAQISPAAGDSDLGINFGEEIKKQKETAMNASETMEKTMAESAKALNEMTSAAGEHIAETTNEIDNSVNNSAETMIEEVSGAITPAQDELETAVEVIEPAAGINTIQENIAAMPIETAPIEAVTPIESATPAVEAAKEILAD